MYEFCDVLYGMIIPVFEGKHSWKDLAVAHRSLERYFQAIADTDEGRLFGKFYRVAFFGQPWGSVNGRAFIYKEPLLTHLFELKDRLMVWFSPKVAANLTHLLESLWRG